METNKEINYRLWLANTIKANLDHCSRLAGVCGCRLDADGVTSYLTDIAEGKSRDEHSSPFPEVLRGRLHGVFQPKHLMLKLACVRDDAAAIDYEFLVEYGLFEPTAGIYFGIKAVSDKWFSDDVFISHAENAVGEFSRRSPNLFKSRRLSMRPLTDNAEDGTYWPLWLPSPGCNDLNEEICYLRTIFRHFIKSLPGLKSVYDRFDEFIGHPYDAGRKALNDLLEKIASTFGSEESAQLFTRFLDNATEEGILVDCGNGQWRFNRHWDKNKRGVPFKMTDKAAFDLMKVLFAVMAEKYGISRKRYIPWQQLRAVMLDPQSHPFDDSWQRYNAPISDTPYYDNCKAFCLRLLQ